MTETGLVPLIALGGWALGELASLLLSEALEAEPLPDDQPMPFRRDGAPASEYVEAFRRLDDLALLARSCRLVNPGEADALRAEVARAINGGIYRADDGSYVEVAEERPTRGQVRAWLSGLATAIGRRCAEGHEAALSAAAAAAPLNQSRGSAGARWSPVLLWGGLAVVGALALASSRDRGSR